MSLLSSIIIKCSNWKPPLPNNGLFAICNNVFSYHSSILFRAHALWALSKSKRNKAVIRRAGGLPLIAKLVKVRHTSILIPVIGTLQECASEKAYCLAIMQSEGMIADLVRNLGTESPKLKMLCASAMYVLITCFHESWIAYLLLAFCNKFDS